MVDEEESARRVFAPTLSGVLSRRASGSDPNFLVTPLWREISPAIRAWYLFRLQLDPDDLANRLRMLIPS